MSVISGSSLPKAPMILVNSRAACSRLAAEIEEAVFDANRLHTKNFFPKRDELLFDFVTRGDVFAFEVVVPGLGRGQRFTVHFVVGRKREFPKSDHCGRDHVIGQLLAQMFPQLRRRKNSASLRNNIGSQIFAAGLVVSRNRDSLLYRRMLLLHSLNFSHLNTETANLDPVIEPSQEVLAGIFGRPRR